MKSLLLAATLLFTLVGCGGPKDENREANRLAVEAKQIYEKNSQSQGAGNRAIAVKEAISKLERIVTRYPGSDLAVKLLNGEPVAGLRVDELRKELFQLETSCNRDSYAFLKPYMVDTAPALLLISKFPAHMQLQSVCISKMLVIDTPDKQACVRRFIRKNLEGIAANMYLAPALVREGIPPICAQRVRPSMRANADCLLDLPSCDETERARVLRDLDALCTDIAARCEIPLRTLKP